MAMDSVMFARPPPSSTAPGLNANPPIPSPPSNSEASWIACNTHELSPTPIKEPLKPHSSPSKSSAVTNCYVFKSRLQEYAQKVGFSTPVYQTVKEGPSHEPVFKSTVIVNNVKYDSLPGFFNRKASEQSAAEVALIEINKSGHMTECIPTPHETGLCKNMLQEYAQKMNYAIPSYISSQQPSGYLSTVEIGGIQYIGAAARTKKEAEIKAARTALLAIQYGSQTSSDGASQYTVLPGKKKATESQHVKAPKQLKPKKASLKKKWTKKPFPRKKGNRAVSSIETGDPEANQVNQDQPQTEGLISHEQGPGKANNEPQIEVSDFEVSTIETSGYCQGVHQEGSGLVALER